MRNGITTNPRVAATLVWICVIQFGFICGVEAVFVSVVTGSPQFDHHYEYPEPALIGLMTAFYPIFAGAGALFTLLLCKVFSRKAVLQIASGLWTCGFILGCFLLRQSGMLCARALKGFAIGIITSILAPYIESIQPLVSSVKVLTAFQGVVPFALLVTSLCVSFLHHYFNYLDFNICWIIAATPALSSVLTTACLPNVHAVAQKDTISVRTDTSIFKHPVRARVLKAMFIQAGVQLTGINVVLYYVGSMCAMIGFSTREALYMSMGLYGCNFLATLLSIPVIDRFVGRKSLALGALAMAVCHGLMFVFSRMEELETHRHLGIACIACCYAFIVVFSVFFNGSSFVYTSRLVPLPHKTNGVGLAIATGWLANAALSAAMPIVMPRLKSITFLIFNILCSLIYMIL